MLDITWEAKIMLKEMESRILEKIIKNTSTLQLETEAKVICLVSNKILTARIDRLSSNKIHLPKELEKIKLPQRT